MTGPSYENGRALERGASASAEEMSVVSDASENAGTAFAEVPASRDPKALIAHVKAGHDLIPVDGKVPAEKGWRRLPPLSPGNARSRMARGGNIGVRLRETDLVIDVDPRHFRENDDSLDPRVIARMAPADRAALIDLLGRYLTVEADAAIKPIN